MLGFRPGARFLNGTPEFHLPVPAATRTGKRDVSYDDDSNSGQVCDVYIACICLGYKLKQQINIDCYWWSNIFESVVVKGSSPAGQDIACFYIDIKSTVVVDIHPFRIFLGGMEAMVVL